MDNITLKKKLSSYITDKGQLRNLNEDILYEVLIAWENWTGPSADFYRTLGFTYKQMAGIIGKAKKLKREGYYGAGEFKQVSVESVEAPGESQSSPGSSCLGAEVIWPGGRVIRFRDIDLLLTFLKKTA